MKSVFFFSNAKRLFFYSFRDLATKECRCVRGHRVSEQTDVVENIASYGLCSLKADDFIKREGHRSKVSVAVSSDFIVCSSRLRFPPKEPPRRQCT